MPVADRSKAVSLRLVRKYVSAHSLRLDHVERWQDKASVAIRAVQAQGEWDAIQREAGEAALDARLRVHRCEIDQIEESAWRAGALAEGAQRRLDAFEHMPFLGRLRWLFTGEIR